MTDAISADEKTTIITFAYISSILLFSLFFRLMYLNLIKFENRSGFLSICVNGKVKVYQFWENKNVPPLMLNAWFKMTGLSRNHLPAGRRYVC